MLTDQQVARVCHQANKAYCEELGDTSQRDYEKAPDWQTEGALRGVKMHRADPYAGAEASHESWMKEKVDAGWVYGMEKDAELKTHPCLVMFGELPWEQQAKDVLFRGIVHALTPDE